MKRSIVIGDDVSIRFYAQDGVDGNAGIVLIHKRPDDATPCEGAIPFLRVDDTGRVIDGWTVVTEDPLTLIPSVICNACGIHGFIHSGQWVPA